MKNEPTNSVGRTNPINGTKIEGKKEADM